ncbi:MAG: hypothetical protein FWE10_05580 [Rikenellaceae bacterium]|nr:hypothetical protein [Rikenellaceae bacterium]MCL2693201.1 hypothetical protein [Rikenellaceae bacterium]
MCCKKDKDCFVDIGRGCVFCNCGEEGAEPSVKVYDGCFKLHETDWLAAMPAQMPTDIVEVRFKNTRRSFFQNVNGLELRLGDVVAVESSPGHDIGIISLTGDMVARQMRRVGFNPQNGEFRKIYRKAKPYDIEKWQEAIAMEHETMIRSRQIAAEMGLNMKIGDVEYQGDKIKAIFYYIADERVDFRELIKVFAEQFRIRVEMKQIGARQEAGRIGGLGSCGRELCCASWIASFASVTTNSVRAQEISLNPQKLAGQCSKLKCCMVYELDDYLDARREFPRINGPLQTIEGDYFLVKTDILGRTMSFSTSPGAMVGVVTLPLARVKEIVELNRRGKKATRLADAATVAVTAKAEEPSGFADILKEDSITRFDAAPREGRGGGRHHSGGSSHGNSRNSGSRDGGGQRRNDRHRGHENRQAGGGKDSVKSGGNNDSDSNGGETKPHHGGRGGRHHRGGRGLRSSGGGNSEGSP